ncbi:hypothetical protein ACJZ2D_000298 [Fusarium nematophilum]
MRLSSLRPAMTLLFSQSRWLRPISDGFFTADIVPGDIIELKMGDSVPADIRILEAVNCETNEAVLTGESLPVRKSPALELEDDTGPGDRLNLCCSSTTVTKGRGKGVVFATGAFTEIGAIAAALNDTGRKKRMVRRDDHGRASVGAYLTAWTLTVADTVGEFLGVNVDTPLQRKLSWLFLYVFGFADVIIYAVATAVGTLPVSLILVLTITMAAGNKQMVNRKVVVRNMQSLKALGGVTNICSDKAGTLTQGKMVVKMAWLPRLDTYSGLSLTSSEPKYHTVDTNTEPTSNQALHQYLNIASLANPATVSSDGGQDECRVQGDPTEIAIQVFVTRFNWNRMTLSAGENPRWKQLAQFPFDSEVKKMSVVFQDTSTGETHIFTKSAVERVLSSCATMDAAGHARPMDGLARDEILENIEALAANVAFVIALLAGLTFKGASGVSIFVIHPVEIIWMLLVAGALQRPALDSSKHRRIFFADLRRV